MTIKNLSIAHFPLKEKDPTSKKKTQKLKHRGEQGRHLGNEYYGPTNHQPHNINNYNITHFCGASKLATTCKKNGENYTHMAANINIFKTAKLAERTKNTLRNKTIESMTRSKYHVRS